MSAMNSQPPLPLDVPEPRQCKAFFSKDRVYRYWLVRVWNPRKPVLGVVMLNPSTADEDTDDATIRWLDRFARSQGYGGIEVCNLYALCSREPKSLWKHPDPVGPDNDRHLRRLARRRDTILLAWGANARLVRAGQVTRLIAGACQERGATLGVLGWTKGGQPRHPLYMPANTVLTHITLGGAGGTPTFEDPQWAQLIAVAA